MKKIILSLFGLCIFWGLQAQQTDKTLLTQTLDTLIYHSVPPNTPGGAIAIVSGEKVIYQKAYGMMSMEFQLPNTNHTLFNLASVSKHFTAFCILLLEKEGKLKLDDDVHTYLPNLPKYNYKVTIRELIHHTSGIPSSDNLRLFAGIAFEAPWDAEDEMDIITKYSQLNYKPNDEGNYSNSGYFLLAKIIEKVTGATFSKFITKNVFEPLGMKESFIYDKPGKIFYGKATGYRKEGSSYARMNTDGESVYGSTNLYISLNDIAIWMQNLLNPKVGDKELIARLFKPADVTNAGDTLYYTYGLNIRNYKGMKIADHSGYAMGFRSEIMYFPENNLAVITMSNNESIDNWNITSEVVDLYLNDRLIPKKAKERKEIKIPENVLKNYAGCYKMPNGMKFNFELNNDTLLLVIPGEPKYVMRAESETDFYIQEFDAQCSFAIGSNGKCEEITWRQNNRQPKGMRTENSENIASEALKKYAGIYFNDPLDVTYPVKIKGRALYMDIPKTFETYFGMNKEIELKHIEKDRFYTSELGLVEFTRDSNKIINGFRIVDFGRVKNLAFKRKRA